jgi:hypothetical protein
MQDFPVKYKNPYKKQKREKHTLTQPNYVDPKFYETPEFMKLNEKWNKKLEKAGFEDIEEFNSPKELLKAWHNTRFAAKYTLNMFDETREYYLAAANLLNTFTFKNHRDRKIWTMHSEGIPERHIAQKLNITDWRVRKLIKMLQPRIKKVDK